MRITNNFQSNYGQHGVGFNAIRMSPHPEKWDQRVLRAVLNSETIESIIKENEKIGKDTEVRYFYYKSSRTPEIPAPDDVYLTVKGEKGDIFLSSHSTFKFIPEDFYENKRQSEVHHGPKDIKKDLREQIRAIDHKTSETEGSHSLDYFKNLAAKIIYEPPVKVEPYE